MNSILFILGFLSPANRGALMTCALVLYVCLGTPAGYVAARYTGAYSIFLLCLLFISLTPHWECTVPCYCYSTVRYCTLQYFFSIECVPV
jgi:hypothetical protein